MALIEPELIKSFDLLTYLDWVGKPYTLTNKKHTKKYVGVQCIFHNDQGQYLGIHKDTKAFHCLAGVCGRSGGLLELITELEHISYQEAARRVREFQTGVDTPKPQEQPKAVITPGIHILPPEASKEFKKAHLDYLSGRGFDPLALIAEWDLYCTWNADFYDYRIVAPIKNRNGEIVNFTARDITGRPDAARYLMCDEAKAAVSRKHCLYGIEKTTSIVLIVEGPADVWRMGRGAVATLGTEWNTEQVSELLKLNATDYYVMFDGEKPAIKSADALAQTLMSRGRSAHVLELPEDVDPGELTPEEAKTIREQIGLP